MLLPERLLLLLGATARSVFELRHFQRLSEARRKSSAAPERFVEGLVRLGPLFVKVGQILSTRPDVLPKQYIAALQRLQEHVPPMPFPDVEAVVLRELRATCISDVFSSFDEMSTASASVAQVHFATLITGEEVAVKVQRRGVENQMQRDLAVLATLVGIGALIAPGLARAFNIRAGFAEFRRYTLQELDFQIEARTMDAFRHNFADWPDVVIPALFPAYVTKRVLTMERAPGKRVDVIADSLSHDQRRALGHRLLEIEMKMFISDGLFHADLHPGNILFRGDGTIVLLDFGMYGSLTEEHRDRFMLYWFYVMQKRTKLAFHQLIAQTRHLATADEGAYYQLFKTLAERFYDSTITTNSLTKTYLTIIAAGAKYGFVFPSDLLLQAKALTTAEALAFVLTPDLRFEDEAQPIIAREFARRIADPRRLRRRLEDAVPELLLFGQLPDVQSAEGDGDEAKSARLWSSVVFALVERLPVSKPDIRLFRALIDPTTKPILVGRHGRDGPAILEQMWTGAAERWGMLAPQATLGATITVRLAAATASAYGTLVAHGAAAEEATQTVYDIAWAFYQKMGAAAWIGTGALGIDGTDRLRLVTDAFRSFPFSAPSYKWESVPGEAGVIAFNCLKCPVAEYFKTQDLSDLCVRTWCALDFPLAADLWDAQLVRSGSIAGGASRCDFRWHANNLDIADHPRKRT